jgi:RNA polymerase sigma-70 factor (ECF subfamily)
MAAIVPVASETGGFGSDGSPDAELVEALRGGSREAFERLYEQYRARIYNLTLRILQSPEDARDVTQDVFIKVYRRLPAARVTGLQFKPWLYRVAINACYDHLRTRRVHRDIDDVVTDTRATMVDTFEQAELSRLVEETLEDLSERHRTVLVLKDIHGLRHEEIAGILGISRGAAETLLFRARESFRAHYADLTREIPIAACSVARDAAVAAVGGELRGDERRRVLAHAQHCPTCRKTVSAWSTAAVGLGVFIHEVPLPAALQGGLPFGGLGAAGGTAAAGTGAGSAGGSALAGSVGAAASGAGVTAGSSAGLSLAAGGLFTKISGAAGAKVAALVVAATCTAGGGVAAYETGVLPGIHPGPATPAMATGHDAGAGAKADKDEPPGLAVAAGHGGKGAERSAGARDKGKGKAAVGSRDNKGERGKSAAAEDKIKTSKGNAGGGSAARSSAKDKPDKSAKAKKTDKLEKPERPDRPDKPAKTDKLEKADKTESDGSQLAPG